MEYERVKHGIAIVLLQQNDQLPIRSLSEGGNLQRTVEYAIGACRKYGTGRKQS